MADAYLFTVLAWSKMLDVDMTKWPILTHYLGRVADRPVVKDVMKAEGLVS